MFNKVKVVKKRTMEFERARNMAKCFLELPMGETKFSPVVVLRPFFESAFLFNGEEWIIVQSDDK